MAWFNEKSLQKLSECHADLQTLFNEVIKTENCLILCGFRGEQEQNKMVLEKKSMVNFPGSKHNQSPSLAVDAAPIPLDWNNKQAFCDFAARVKAIAERLNIKIAWGGDYKSFFDGIHFELI